MRERWTRDVGDVASDTSAAAGHAETRQDDKDAISSKTPEGGKDSMPTPLSGDRLGRSGVPRIFVHEYVTTTCIATFVARSYCTPSLPRRKERLVTSTKESPGGAKKQ